MNDKKKKQIEDFKKIGIKNPNICFSNQIDKVTSEKMRFSVQFDQSILNQISFLFYLIFRIYDFWINCFFY